MVDRDQGNNPRKRQPPSIPDEAKKEGVAPAVDGVAGMPAKEQEGRQEIGAQGAQPEVAQSQEAATEEERFLNLTQRQRQLVQRYQVLWDEAKRADEGIPVPREVVSSSSSTGAAISNGSFEWRRAEGLTPDHPAQVIANKFTQHCALSHADTAVVVYKGQVVSGSDPSGVSHDVFYAPWAPSTSGIASSTKSVGAVAVFCFLDDTNQLELLDKPIVQYLNWPTWQTHPYASKITLRHLLTHTSGLPGNDSFRDLQPNGVDGDDQFGGYDDLNQAVRDLVLVRDGETPIREPDQVFDYSNPGAQATATVLSELVAKHYEGKTLADYVHERIFNRLGMMRTTLDCFAQGEPCFYGGIHTTALDLARVGLMLSQGGIWEGMQFISDAAMTEMLRSPSQPTGPLQKASPRVAHLWGLSDPSKDPAPTPCFFRSLGYRNSTMHIFPDHDLILVRLQSFDSPPGKTIPPISESEMRDALKFPSDLVNQYGAPLRKKT